jgi:hypothetical protein
MVRAHLASCVLEGLDIEPPDEYEFMWLVVPCAERGYHLTLIVERDPKAAIARRLHAN